tara:strand:+ start:343 stop:651 length:309 start_codon:yes stop_codon:yes gene_type:complete
LYGTHEGPLRSWKPVEIPQEEESDEEEPKVRRKWDEDAWKNNLDMLRMNMVGYGAPRDYVWYKDTQYQNLFLGKKPKYGPHVDLKLYPHVKQLEIIPVEELK